MTILYYMEMMGVDRPDRTHHDLEMPVMRASPQIMNSLDGEYERIHHLVAGGTHILFFTYIYTYLDTYLPIYILMYILVYIFLYVYINPHIYIYLHPYSRNCHPIS